MQCAKKKLQKSFTTVRFQNFCISPPGSSKTNTSFFAFFPSKLSFHVQNSRNILQKEPPPASTWETLDETKHTCEASKRGGSSSLIQYLSWRESHRKVLLLSSERSITNHFKANCTITKCVDIGRTCDKSFSKTLFSFPTTTMAAEAPVWSLSKTTRASTRTGCSESFCQLMLVKANQPWMQTDTEGRFSTRLSQEEEEKVCPALFEEKKKTEGEKEGVKNACHTFRWLCEWARVSVQECM